MKSVNSNCSWMHRDLNLPLILLAGAKQGQRLFSTFMVLEEVQIIIIICQFLNDLQQDQHCNQYFLIRWSCLGSIWEVNATFFLSFGLSNFLPLSFFPSSSSLSPPLPRRTCMPIKRGVFLIGQVWFQARCCLIPIIFTHASGLLIQKFPSYLKCTTEQKSAARAAFVPHKDFFFFFFKILKPHLSLWKIVKLNETLKRSCFSFPTLGSSCV